jgi:3-hydroxyacyl-[acyl-carrier-protein] dehydratase
MKLPLPHRSPFILVDAIVERVPGRRAAARRLVSAGDPLLRDATELGGLLLVEAMAQCAGIAAAGDDGVSGMLAAIDGFRVHAPVVAGDSLLIEACIVKRMGTMVKAKATALVGGDVRAECDLVLRLGPAAEESQ